MGVYFFLRYGVASFAFVAWLAWQKMASRKSWNELKPDIIAITFFIAVWIGISYWIMS